MTSNYLRSAKVQTGHTKPRITKFFGIIYLLVFSEAKRHNLDVMLIYETKNFTQLFLSVVKKFGKCSSEEVKWLGNVRTSYAMKGKPFCQNIRLFNFIQIRWFLKNYISFWRYLKLQILFSFFKCLVCEMLGPYIFKWINERILVEYS